METYRCCKALNMSPEEYERTNIKKIAELLAFDSEVKEWEKKKIKQEAAKR